MKSYVGLSFNVANPIWSQDLYSRLGLPGDITTVNTVLAASCLGLYLYNRPTLAGRPLHVRGAYSFYHSTIFVLGSVLSWAILARTFSNNTGLKTVLTVGSSVFMLKVTKDSLDHLDSRLGNTLGRK